MAWENYVVTSNNGVLYVEQNRRYITTDKKEHTEKFIYQIVGNIDGLKEGDILRGYNLDFDLKRTKYTKDGKPQSKTMMWLHGWEKVEEV